MNDFVLSYIKKLYKELNIECNLKIIKTFKRLDEVYRQIHRDYTKAIWRTIPNSTYIIVGRTITIKKNNIEIIFKKFENDPKMYFCFNNSVLNRQTIKLHNKIEKLVKKFNSVVE